jgi:transcriptional regulator with GAF, ATPase, and Fis domain
MRVSTIRPEHLPREARALSRIPPPTPAPRKDERSEVERALAMTGGNISHAARQLGLTRHGLKKRMVRLGMRPARQGNDE